MIAASPTSYPNYARIGMGIYIFSSIDFVSGPLYSFLQSNKSVCLTGHGLWRSTMGNSSGNKEREEFADAINRAAFGNERVLLRRRGRAVAAVVPITDLRLLEALENRIDLVDAREALAQANKKGARPLDVILKELGV
jgi:antitoxin (DNA-binding transcriptional repressor) of toxin-antitoxin stability system